VISLNQGPTTEEKRAQLVHVVNSNTLQNAPMLQKLLQFLGTCGIDGGSAGEISDWVIATTAFGRPKEFDPTTDTTVRTSVYRLRSKLREYYASEGMHDPVVIEIPKGHHVPIFTKREFDTTERAADGNGSQSKYLDPPLATSPAAGRGIRQQRHLLAAVTVLLMTTSLFAGRYWGKTATLLHLGNSPQSAVLGSFWRAFAANNRPLIVAYSNSELLQTETRDLLHYDAGAVDDRGAAVDPGLAARSVTNPQVLRAHTLFYENGYTGTGEVQSVFSLTRVLTQLGIEVITKRVPLLTADDLKTHNVVFLGSTLESRVMDDLRLKQGYAFDLPLHSMWAGRIIDKRQSFSAKPVSYAVERDPATRALRVDYAIASVTQGIAPDRKIMVLGGLTTSGTEGAAELVTSEPNVAELLKSLNVSPKVLDQDHALPFFESVVQVPVVHGLDPINVKCVAARRIRN